MMSEQNLIEWGQKVKLRYKVWERQTVFLALNKPNERSPTAPLVAIGGHYQSVWITQNEAWLYNNVTDMSYIHRA